jgi:hypothetical protein
MSSGSARRDALEAAADAVRAAQRADYDEIEAARRVLRDASRAHARAARSARQRLAPAGREAGTPVAGHDEQRAAAERELATAEAAQRGIEEARPLLRRLDDLVQDGEAVLDMAPGLSAGHDGVLVATDRRLLFIAPRRLLDHPYEGITAVTAKGRGRSSRLLVSSGRDHVAFSGLTAGRAGALAELIRHGIAEVSARGG